MPTAKRLDIIRIQIWESKGGELMDFNAIMASIGEAFSELMNLLAGKGFPVEEITAFLGEIVSKIMGMFA